MPNTRDRDVLVPRIVFLLVASTLVLSCGGTEAPQPGTAWGQFRGPNRDGVAPDFSGPDEWPDAPLAVWNTNVGAGYASPVTDGTAVFVHSRVGQLEVVSALDFATGDLVWSDQYDAPTTKAPEFAASEGEGPYATPVLDEGALYTFGVHGIASAYDAESGDLRWRHDLGDRIVEVERSCGVASSPLIVDDRVVLQIGDDDSGEVLALSLEAGDPVWTWSGPAAGNASPVLATIDNVPQIITMTDEAAVAFDAADGTLLWRHPLQGVPGSCSTNIPSPVVAEQVVIIAGIRHGTEAVAPMHGVHGWKVDTVWKNDEIKPFWSNFVLEGAELFGVSGQRKGQLFALDPVTGEALWTTDGRSGENGSVLAAGDYVFFVMNEGDLHIARRTRPGLVLIAEYTVADAAVWAYPLIHDGDLLVKAGGMLTRWSFD